MQFQNRFRHYLSADFAHCVPVLSQKGLNEILAKTAYGVAHELGSGPSPKLVIDLEQLQIADYAAFEGISESQRDLMQNLHSREPIKADEMLFLALRSLFQFVWEDPESEHDIRVAQSYDLHLDSVLVEVAIDLSCQFRSASSLLPYWGRLAFLNAMQRLPSESIGRFGLDTASCTLVKRSKFNATTFAVPGSPMIAMNDALEPILKHLNRYLLHFFCTQKMAGPIRLQRAWENIVPTVIHFWSTMATPNLTRGSTVLYGTETATAVHQLTAEQIEFIMMHEVGHIVFDHPNRLKATLKDENNTELRHEFEFAADAFALGLIRSTLIESVRNAPCFEKLESDEATCSNVIVNSLHKYQQGLGGIYLLFTYMDFIQRSGELLRDRLGSRIRFSDKMDTHPRAISRLERLEQMNMGELLYTSPIQRYAKSFFQSVLDFASGLTDDVLYDSTFS